ncbi:hypothetical protein [Paenibacillus polymyxa]|uniref:hypothetical protein n=1 Tax=Paenibacillus polymyxa TaxID=1406 RepID=UPI002ED3D948
MNLVEMLVQTKEKCCPLRRQVLNSITMLSIVEKEEMILNIIEVIPREIEE